jgi:hypothetical protein
LTTEVERPPHPKSFKSFEAPHHEGSLSIFPKGMAMLEVSALMHARKWSFGGVFFSPRPALYTIITPFMFYAFGYIATLSLTMWGPLV